MYGMVNRGISQLVRSQFGDDTWEEVLDAAGIDDDVFLAMEPYDDSVTYDLVGAVCTVTGLSAEEVLETFGEYWIVFTAKEGYGELLELGGSDVKSFLTQLNNMHAQIKLSFPVLEPPSFEVEALSDDRLRLTYRSTRPGLTPMVVGLLRGLAKIKNETIEFLDVQAGEVGEPDIFELQLQPARETTS